MLLTLKSLPGTWKAINHCLLTRADLSFQREAARAIPQVAIPEDGEWLNLLESYAAALLCRLLE